MKTNKKKYPWIKITFYMPNGRRKVVLGGKGSFRRFYSKIKAVQFLKCHILMEYGKKETRHGMEMFYNDGTYTDKKEACEILKAFMEEA